MLSCKKNKDYPVPEEMKQYFVFQKGSYWIYKNDSTGEIDSTYVNIQSSFIDENGYPGKNREVNLVYYTSKFLLEYQLVYACLDACGLSISTKIDTLTADQIRLVDLIAYVDSWQPNTNFTLNGCGAFGIYTYNRLPNKTINNKTYQNIIYSKNTSSDSSSFYREFYFAKNIGIIQFSEKNKYHNFKRSYSLLRHKVIQ